LQHITQKKLFIKQKRKTVIAVGGGGGKNIFLKFFAFNFLIIIFVTFYGTNRDLMQLQFYLMQLH